MPGGLPPQGGRGFPAAPPQQGYAVSLAAGGQRVEWGQRAAAWLIDLGVSIAIFVPFVVLAIVVADFFLLLGYLLNFVWGIYNSIYLQGTSGQTVGKKAQGIKLVSDVTGQPVGMGMTFVRGLLGAFLWALCWLPGILDYLWPLWDSDKKRLADKMLTHSVISGPEKMDIGTAIKSSLPV